MDRMPPNACTAFLEANAAERNRKTILGAAKQRAPIGSGARGFTGQLEWGQVPRGLVFGDNLGPKKCCSR